MDILFLEYAAFEWVSEYVACIRVVTPDKTAGVADYPAAVTTVAAVDTAVEERPAAVLL